jgi:hypothetical protein
MYMFKAELLAATVFEEVVSFTATGEFQFSSHIYGVVWAYTGILTYICVVMDHLRPQYVQRSSDLSCYMSHVLEQYLRTTTNR